MAEELPGGCRGGDQPPGDDLGRRTAARGILLPQGAASTGDAPPLSSVAKSAQLRFRLRRKLRPLPCSSSPHRAGRGGGPFRSCPKRERAAPGVREKDAFGRAPALRASALYGGRRERVPACFRQTADGRGGVRCRLDSGFPRRGCVLGRGARTHLTGSSFRAFRFATRYPGGRRGLCFRADVHIRPLHQFLRGTASGSEKRSNSMR